MRNTILSIFIIITILFGVLVYFIPQIGILILLSISGILTLIAIYDSLQTKHSLLRAFPLIARLRWFFEEERDKIQQYFIEDNLNGTPINREKRSVVYQRAKLEKDTVPFGTQHNVYAKGYEFVKHSLFPKDHHKITGDKVVFGSDKCTQKYDCSIINISAMSFGSLSKNAIMALNQGAKMGNFAHNTGEGGISPYHLQGGDLIFQVGTGYFGAGKSVNGKRVFDDVIFKKNAIRPEVKMIEIKFSQGAKPGHGGILPAKKNTEEIAKIRSVEPGTQVDSPPSHSAFSNYTEMISFIQKVRDLSGGKPVGIKFCVGDNEEIEMMIKEYLTQYALREDFDRFMRFYANDAILEAHALYESSQQLQTPTMFYSDILSIVYKRLAEAWQIPVSWDDCMTYGQSVRNWPAFPDSAEALAYLKEHYKLVILSPHNQSP